MSLHEDEQLSVSEIADFAVLKLSTTTKIVQRLAQDGLVTTSPRTNDARVTDVRLTEAGDLLRLRAREHAEAVLASAFGTNDADDLAGLNELLEKVFDRLGDADPASRRGRK